MQEKKQNKLERVTISPPNLNGKLSPKDWKVNKNPRLNRRQNRTRALSSLTFVRTSKKTKLNLAKQGAIACFFDMSYKKTLPPGDTAVF